MFDFDVIKVVLVLTGLDIVSRNNIVAVGFKLAIVLARVLKSLQG